MRAARTRLALTFVFVGAMREKAHRGAGDAEAAGRIASRLREIRGRGGAKSGTR